MVAVDLGRKFAGSGERTLRLADEDGDLIFDDQRHRVPSGTLLLRIHQGLFWTDLILEGASSLLRLP